MELTRIDLGAIAAIGHEDGYLGIMIEQEDQLQYLEIPAPLAAYQGLQTLNSIVEVVSHEEECYLTALEYSQEQQCLTMAFDDGSVYQYQGVEPEFWLEFQQKITPEATPTLWFQEA